jgi:formylglycine-generating enzyme required for sulfatase activity
MRVNAEAVAKGGYRLPTDAEWEYVCRAGTVSSRYYGHTAELMGAYEWYVANSGYHAHARGRLLPNDLGLFDMLGNVMEWCHDRHQEGQPGPGGTTEDQILEERSIGKDKRYIRCDKYNGNPPDLRSAVRGWFDPWDKRSDLGFRPARTCP